MSIKARYERFFGRYTEDKINRFLSYHKNNPHIYSKFKDMAYQVKATGRDRYSAEIIISVLRWDRDISTRSGDEYKISDSWRSMYARLLAYEYPEFENFFSFKGMDK